MDRQTSVAAVAVQPLSAQALGDLTIAIDLIGRSPTNPRETFDDARMAKLAESIARHGVLQPILVRPWPEAYAHPAPRPIYELVAGERRWRAARAAGLTTLPARARALTDHEVLEIQIIENLQREDLHPIEEANGYERMMHDYGYTADTLAEKIGKSKAYIYARCKLTALCHVARKAFREGALNPSTALLIARIPTTKLQERATKEITDPNWRDEAMSVRQAQQHIHDRYMLRLVEAPFPTGDMDLLKKVGSCDACPKRTGNQPADLFEDVPSADVCTDPDCHQQKREAHMQRQADAAAARGQTVITGKEAAKLIPNGYSVEGHAKLDDKCYDDTQFLTYRELLAGQPVEAVLIEDRTNHTLVECIPDKTLAAALKAAGITRARDRMATDRKKTEAAVDTERTYRAALFTATREAVREDYARSGARLTDDDMRVIAARFYDSLGFDMQRRLLKHYVDGKVAHEQVRAFAEQLAAYTSADLCLLLIDMALIGETCVHEYSMKHAPERLLAFAASAGVDPDEIRLKLAAEARAKASSPSKAARAREAKAPKRTGDAAAPGGKAKTATPAAPAGETKAGKTKSGRASPSERKSEEAIETNEKPIETGTGYPNAKAALIEMNGKAKARRAGSSVAYRHPTADLTWSGRGKQPKWVEDWIAAGGTLEALKGAA